MKFLEALREGGYDELAAKLENPDMAANTAVVQASDSTELEELKEALKEQSEVIQAMNKELEQVFDLNLMRPQSNRPLCHGYRTIFMGSCPNRSENKGHT